MPPMGHGELSFSLDVSQVVDSCQRAINILDRHVRRALNRAAVIVANSARREHGYQDRSGALTAAIAAGTVQGGTELNVDVTADTPYADAIERGARPHKIRAKPGKKLRFGTVSGVVFCDEVNHPGNPPFRFLADALERQQDDVHAMLSRGLEDGLSEAGFEVLR